MDAYLAIASRRDERRYRPTRCPRRRRAHPRRGPAVRLGGQPPAVDVRRSRRRASASTRIAETVFEPGNIHGAALVVAIVVSGKGPVRFDAGRAAQNMLLAAWNAGVSSCPNGIADAERLHAALELAEDEEVAIVLSFGLPERARDVAARSAEEWSARANRKPLDEVVRRLD